MRRSHFSLGTLVWAVFAAIGVLIQVLIVYESMHPHFTIDADAVSAVCSTGAQIVAGMYGLTLAGYVFYADKLKDTADRDESLRDVVEDQKKHNYVLIMFISAMSLIAFLSSILLLLYGSENTIVPEFWHRLIIMETCLFTFQVVTLIIYFVLTMLDPKAVERSSRRGKEQISSDREPAGSVTEFLKSYQEIELRIQDLQRKRSTESHHVHPRPVPHDLSRLRPEHQELHHIHVHHRPGSEEALAEVLPEPLLQNVITVRKYRNYLIHSRKWTVTQTMCDLAAQVGRELRELDAAEQNDL